MNSAIINIHKIQENSLIEFYYYITHILTCMNYTFCLPSGFYYNKIETYASFDCNK